MALVNLGAVMDAIATTCTGASLAPRAYPYPADTISPPCVVVGYPVLLSFDMTYQRGADQADIPVYFVVGRPNELAARTALSAILADATSVKSALDGTLGGVVSSLRVTDCRVMELEVNTVTYLAAVFNAEVLS